MLEINLPKLPKSLKLGAKKPGPGATPYPGILDLSGDPTGAVARSVLLCPHVTTGGGGLSSAKNAR